MPMRNACSGEGALSHAVTAHFFRGLLNTCSRSREPALTVDETLVACRTKCPLLVASALLWWPRLDAELQNCWARCSPGSEPRELQRLREAQLFAGSLLSSNTMHPPSSPAWLLAAALHFTIQRTGQDSIQSELGKLPSSPGEQLLLSLFFFSLMRLLSSHLSPQTAHPKRALGICAEILSCLKMRRISWLQLFELRETDTSLGCVLLRLVPDQHVRLLPFAFYRCPPEGRGFPAHHSGHVLEAD